MFEDNFMALIHLKGNNAFSLNISEISAFVCDEFHMKKPLKFPVEIANVNFHPQLRTVGNFVAYRENSDCHDCPVSFLLDNGTIIELSLTETIIDWDDNYYETGQAMDFGDILAMGGPTDFVTTNFLWFPNPVPYSTVPFRHAVLDVCKSTVLQEMSQSNPRFILFSESIYF
jgi:hypothetical protein